MYERKNPTSIKLLFDNISNDYDKMNNVMSFGMQNIIKKLSINRLNAKKPQKIIDLCTGTGDIAILLAKKYPNAEITGIDFSEKMIKLAKEKTKKYPNIKIKQGNVMDLKIEDNSFDICTISFGLRNLPDIEQSITEMNRILKKEGIISILDLGRVYPIVAPIYNFYFFKIIPLIGKIIHKENMSYKYLVNSLPEYPPPNEILKILKKNKFTNTKNINYAFGAIAQQTGIK